MRRGAKYATAESSAAAERAGAVRAAAAARAMRSRAPNHCAGPGAIPRTASAPAARSSAAPGASPARARISRPRQERLGGIDRPPRARARAATSASCRASAARGSPSAAAASAHHHEQVVHPQRSAVRPQGARGGVERGVSPVVVAHRQPRLALQVAHRAQVLALARALQQRRRGAVLRQRLLVAPGRTTVVPTAQRARPASAGVRGEAAAAAARRSRSPSAPRPA